MKTPLKKQTKDYNIKDFFVNAAPCRRNDVTA